jgi:hypothetical protein
MFERAAFAALLAAGVGMLALTVGLWSGYFIANDDEASAPAVGQAPLEAPARAVASRTPTKPVTIRLVARRGACWLSVRMDSRTGKRLFLGTLRRGRTLRFTGPRIWMRIGAAEKLDVSLNGRRVRDFPEGVAELSITAERIARV